MKDTIGIKAPAAITRTHFLRHSPRQALAGTTISPRRPEDALSRIKVKTEDDQAGPGMASPLQHRQAPFIAGMSTASATDLHARATPSG